MQYTDPDQTVRAIVETSLAAIEARISTIVEAIGAAQAVTDLDYQTNQIVAQHIGILSGAKMSLENERIRLTNIIRAWDGEEPLPMNGQFTPTMPTQPL